MAHGLFNLAAALPLAVAVVVAALAVAWLLAQCPPPPALPTPALLQAAGTTCPALSRSTLPLVFSGSLTTNGCPNHAGAYQYNGVLDARVPAASASCQTWTLPVSGYVAGAAKAAPLRSSIGYTISGGEAIYGPMDAGFTLGQVTTTSCGSCPAGTDTRFCAAYIERACGTAALRGNTSASMHMLLSDCGGHAGYHNHESLSCEYTAAAAGHSGLVAVLLDGRGVYGQYESTGVRPTDLDACGGHMGPTPATTVGADTYHYHMTTEAPFVAGCFGPVTSLAAAKALYPSCAAGGAACVCSSAATCTCSAGQVMGATHGQGGPTGLLLEPFSHTKCAHPALFP
jgi:hypothetical protein